MTEQDLMLRAMNCVDAYTKAADALHKAAVLTEELATLTSNNVLLEYAVLTLTGANNMHTVANSIMTGEPVSMS